MDCDTLRPEAISAVERSHPAQASRHPPRPARYHHQLRPDRRMVVRWPWANVAIATGSLPGCPWSRSTPAAPATSPSPGSSRSWEACPPRW